MCSSSCHSPCRAPYWRTRPGAHDGAVGVDDPLPRRAHRAVVVLGVGDRPSPGPSVESTVARRRVVASARGPQAASRTWPSSDDELDLARPGHERRIEARGREPPVRVRGDTDAQRQRRHAADNRPTTRPSSGGAKSAGRQRRRPAASRRAGSANTRRAPGDRAQRVGAHQGRAGHVVRAPSPAGPGRGRSPRTPRGRGRRAARSAPTEQVTSCTSRPANRRRPVRGDRRRRSPAAAASSVNSQPSGTSHLGPRCRRSSTVSSTGRGLVAETLAQRRRHVREAVVAGQRRARRARPRAPPASQVGDVVEGERVGQSDTGSSGFTPVTSTL